MDITIEIVKEMTAKESHIPIPTRYADIMTHKIRREQRIEEKRNFNETKKCSNSSKRYRKSKTIL